MVITSLYWHFLVYHNYYLLSINFIHILNLNISVSYEQNINKRSERDLNPRIAINDYTLSRRAPSTTRTPLHKKIPYTTLAFLLYSIWYEFTFLILTIYILYYNNPIFIIVRYIKEKIKSLLFLHSRNRALQYYQRW